MINLIIVSEHYFINKVFIVLVIVFMISIVRLI